MAKPAQPPGGAEPPRLPEVIMLSATAMILGGLAGGVAAITYLAMIGLQTVIWHDLAPERWAILPITVLGGVLIGWAQRHSAGPDLEVQLARAHDPETIHRRESLWLAVSAIIAVGFGGAVGPEAGLLAVTMQLSAIVALTLGRKAAERRTLSEAGASGALAGFYGTPVGGPLHTQGEAEMPRPVLFLAGFAGFIAFIWTAEFLREGAVAMMWLPRLTAEAGRWDAVIALLPGAGGALAGVFFLWSRGAVTARLTRHVPNAFWRPVLGGLGLGLICTALPILLFSGHNEIEHMLRLGAERGAPLLVALGLGKALACALCVGSGWKGGLIFPLCFAGGALGAATLAVLPGLDPVMGVAAGMAGASAVGMARPILAGVIMLFVLGGGLAVPVLVGTLIGWGVLRMLPARLTSPAAH